MRYLAIVFVLILFLIAPFAQSKNLFSPALAISANSQAGVLKMTLVGQPYDLNPITAPSSCAVCWQVISLEYSYGLPVLQNGSVYTQNSLFDWVESNANATVWNFNIRPGATWSDGQPINSTDVYLTFELDSVYLPHGTGNFQSLSRLVQDLSEINSSDAEFVLNQTNEQFGAYLSTQYYFSIVPSHIWISSNISGNPNFAQDVTSGPFYHLNYNNGSELILKANPYYWDPPKLSEIDINFTTSWASTPTLLLSNVTDLAPLDPTTVAQFLNNQKFGLATEPDRSILYLGYNTALFPFDNLSFRQAVAQSINTTAIVQDVYSGYATPGILGDGTIPPSATLWHNPNASQYPYNVSEAKTLLGTLGFSWNSNGSLLYPNGTAVAFQIYTDSEVPSGAEAAHQVANYLSQLGMDTTVLEEPLDAIIQSYQSRSSEIRNELMVLSSTAPIFGLGPLDAQPGYDVYLPWSSSQWISNASADSQFNQQLNIINSSADQTVVQQAVRQVDLLNSQNLPVTVLAYPDGIWAYSTQSGITGFPAKGSTLGMDMGDNSLDPYTLSQLSCVAGPCSIQTTITSTTSTTQSTSGSVSTSSPTFLPSSSLTATSSSSRLINSSSSPSNSSASVAEKIIGQNDNLLEVATVTTVILLIIFGSLLSRRNPPKPPAPPPNTEI